MSTKRRSTIHVYIYYIYIQVYHIRYIPVIRGYWIVLQTVVPKMCLRLSLLHCNALQTICDLADDSLEVLNVGGHFARFVFGCRGSHNWVAVKEFHLNDHNRDI